MRLALAENRRPILSRNFRQPLDEQQASTGKHAGKDKSHELGSRLATRIDTLLDLRSTGIRHCSTAPWPRSERYNVGRSILIRRHEKILFPLFGGKAIRDLTGPLS
jgi:hypothetical protein